MMSVLIWIQTVCKSEKQTTKVTDNEIFNVAHFFQIVAGLRPLTTPSLMSQLTLSLLLE